MTISQQQLQFDRNHIWHPYTNLNKPTPVFGVESAQGVYLTLSNGKKVIDGMASWWSAIHGYNHPELNQAIHEQIQQMSHVMFGGLTHQPAIELSRQLIDLTAPELDCVFLADSGSVAVEVGLKMALQYWYSLGRQQKSKFLTIRNGYHGDTLGAMSVCDPETGMHSMFSETLPQHLFVPSPSCVSDEDWNESHIAEFRQMLESRADEIAAVILEPIVQGTGGMRIYCPEFLRQVKSLCEQHDVLLILDEIATGFGRTGTMFAYEQAQICPDILCIGKAITGGYLSLAATITTRNVADVIGSYGDGNLMHGPTFMANPLACAVANRNIELLLASPWQQKIKQIEAQLIAELASCRQLESVADVRVKGAIGAVELKSPVDMHKVQPRFVELGVWIRPFGKLLYIMPPYIIEPDQLSCLTKAIEQVAREQIKP
ncbi:adenosylmethionine--8-amino-7-oxononanoate transaminase [Aliikangiella coralliicola]|uniref:Adenosylmethionine-8-amino-7-oxononanoate aminotransferase n=1 Tax=Aliikangiella coralliicola TaxID=2592383 RepID=A0A545TW50_9GAMM|nr:adenosylmethionine--8-amino-7-oxononanoate transaminase [Aliikangiella coralliicola]TQV81446.1 adenosylmethionine--8-amino-7-oxononanoate transaminase [Aliikangiella coralliicola]